MERFQPEIPKDLITGTGLESERVYEKLPATAVKNEVVWVNRDLELPFDFKVGEQTALGLFLTPEKPGEEIFAAKVLERHRRSFLLGKVIFQDKEGRLYRDIDLKGSGRVGGSSGMGFRVDRVENPRADPQVPQGIADWGYVETDREMSEFFLKKGLRTHRVVAVIKLEEIIDEFGKPIPVVLARRRGMIGRRTEPAIEIRAFGTKARIWNVNELLVKDAMAMVAQELGIKPEDFGKMSYLQWFAKTLGEQVAIIHNSGYFHGYLTPHNITLDCRIVDLDSVDKLPETKNKLARRIKEDFNDVRNSFAELIRRGNYGDKESTDLELRFISSYMNHLNPEILNAVPSIKRKNEEMEKNYFEFYGNENNDSG